MKSIAQPDGPGGAGPDIAVDSLQLSVAELMTHIAIFGQTGSGKTRFALMPLIESTLRAFGVEASTKAGALVFDSKGDMEEHLRMCLRAVGREQDLLIIGPGGNAWLPLFEAFGGNTREAALYLISLAQVSVGNVGKGENDLFWIESATRLLEAILIVAKAKHGCGYGGVEGLRTAFAQVRRDLSLIRDEDEDDSEPTSRANGKGREALPTARAGLVSGAIDYREYQAFEATVDGELAKTGQRTLGCIIQYGHNFIGPFESQWIANLLTPNTERVAYSPEGLIDDGKIVLVQLSPTIIGKSALPLANAIKLSFQRAALQRRHTYIDDGSGERRINQTRPILFVIDEFHTLCTVGPQDGDPYFFDRAREFGVAAIVATQGISALNAVVTNSAQVDHMLNNCTTKIFFRSVNCPQTSGYLDKVSGTEEKLVESRSSNRIAAPPRFRLPNHTFAPPYCWSQSSLSHRLEDRPRLNRELLRKLKTGEAVVLRRDGRIDHVKFTGGRYVSAQLDHDQ